LEVFGAGARGSNPRGGATRGVVRRGRAPLLGERGLGGGAWRARSRSAYVRPRVESHPSARRGGGVSAAAQDARACGSRPGTARDLRLGVRRRRRRPSRPRGARCALGGERRRRQRHELERALFVEVAAAVCVRVKVRGPLGAVQTGEQGFIRLGSSGVSCRQLCGAALRGGRDKDTAMITAVRRQLVA